MRSLTTSSHVSRHWTEDKCRRMQPEISMKIMMRKMREDGPFQTIVNETVSFLKQEQKHNPALRMHDFLHHLVKAAATHFYSLPDILKYTDQAMVSKAHIVAQLKKKKILTNSLLAAASAGDIPFMVHLLKLGASPTDGHSFFGSPLHGAIQGGHDAAFDLIISHGADINAQYENPGYAPRHEWSEGPELPERTGWKAGDRRAWTTIEDAANAGHSGIVKRLLKSTDAPESWSACNFECKHRALMAAVRRGHIDVIDAFLEFAPPDRVRKMRENIFTQACHHGRSSIVSKMLDYGVDPNLHTERATLYLAAASGDIPTMVLLRNRGAILGRLGWKERYANELIAAAVHGHYEAVDLFLSWGMRLKDGEVGPAIARLLRKQQISAIELMMSRGLDISRAIPFLITRQQYKNGRYIGLLYNPGCSGMCCYLSSPEYTFESSSHIHGPLCVCLDCLGEKEGFVAPTQVRVLRRRATLNWRPSSFWD
jgi:ankyrin repeat protein